MPNLKNIRRNSTRPHANQRPYVQSTYGSKNQEREIQKFNEQEAEKKKLANWNSLK